jgi:hypothetical protein
LVAIAFWAARATVPVDNNAIAAAPPKNRRRALFANLSIADPSMMHPHSRSLWKQDALSAPIRPRNPPIGQIGAWYRAIVRSVRPRDGPIG